MIKGVARKYFEGKTCIFCNKYGLYRLADKRVKCKHCKRKYSLVQIKRDLLVLYYFYLEVSARKAAKELELDYETVQSRFMQFRRKGLSKKS
jgi:vacuolar-type H+-ATPase subunit D/Vma8